MSKDAVSDWDPTPSGNTDIAGIAISNSTTIVSLDNILQAMMGQIRRDLFGPAAFSGLLYGLTLSNNGSDPTNDIDIAAGVAIDSTNVRFMKMAASLTKRLDAAWAVGTNQGGLDTGAIANGTYHVWEIMRSDTGVVDVLFSTSAGSPTMPANYDYKRRIGSIIRSGAAILPFTQVGDEFLLKSAVQDVSVSNLGTTPTNYALTVPGGIRVTALVSGSGSHATATVAAYLYSPDQTDVAASATNFSTFSPVNATPATWEKNIRTNTSSQIRAVAQSASFSLTVNTSGWIDPRGQQA